MLVITIIMIFARPSRPPGPPGGNACYYYEITSIITTMIVTININIITIILLLETASMGFQDKTRFGSDQFGGLPLEYTIIITIILITIYIYIYIYTCIYMYIYIYTYVL